MKKLGLKHVDWMQSYPRRISLTNAEPKKNKNHTSQSKRTINANSGRTAKREKQTLRNRQLVEVRNCPWPWIDKHTNLLHRMKFQLMVCFVSVSSWMMFSSQFKPQESNVRDKWWAARHSVAKRSDSCNEVRGRNVSWIIYNIQYSRLCRKRVRFVKITPHII